MKRTLALAVFFLASLALSNLQAGNPDRVGQSGAYELLINPWPATTGMHGANMAKIGGLEAIRNNVAGLVNTRNLEFTASRSKYLLGTGINMNAFGFSKTLGERNTNAVAVSLTSFNIGDVERTTVRQPEGGLGTFSPSIVNVSAGYAKRFSNAIKGGVAFRFISESLADVSATGVAVNAGIQYSTNLSGGKSKNSHFGIALRNVGTPMQFSGGGLNNRATLQNSDFPQTVRLRSNSFELPSLLSISLAQDIPFGKENAQEVTLAAKFISNSFTRNQYTFGAEYSISDVIDLRGGFLYEEDIFSEEANTTVYTGPSAGFSVNVPFGEEKDLEGRDITYRNQFSFDYSYRATRNFDGVHSLGVTLNL
jgi:hypothetical protein